MVIIVMPVSVVVTGCVQKCLLEPQENKKHWESHIFTCSEYFSTGMRKRRSSMAAI